MSRKDGVVQVAEEICKREHFDIVLDRLLEKTTNAAWKRKKTTTASPISLWQINEDREYVISLLTDSLQSETYMPTPYYQTILRADQKERIIYQQHWIDKIVQMVLANILGESLNSFWSDRLFSFRKGRSNKLLLSDCAAYIRKHPGLYFYHCDISSYAQSIHQETLAQKILEQIGPQSPYIEKLLTEFISPLYKIPDQPEKRRLRKGTASGIPLTPIFENIYLADLDKILETVTGLFYGRYGDDIILLHEDESILEDSKQSLLTYVADHKLTIKPEKTAQGQFGVEDTSIKYLGLMLREDGTVALPPQKLRHFKKKITSICTHTYAMCRHNHGKQELIDYMIKNVNHYLLEVRLIPYLDYLSMNEYCSTELKKLDTWIAKQILRPIFGTSHDRVFRYVSRKKLISKGLLSLQNIKHYRVRRHNNAS